VSFSIFVFRSFDYVFNNSLFFLSFDARALFLNSLKATLKIFALAKII
jgi:hypothetical protein